MVHRGAVHIVETPDWDVTGSQGSRYDGHWSATENGQAVFLEQGPGWDSVDAALVWARERADVVWLRTGQPGASRVYSAGRLHPNPEVPVWGNADST